MFSLYGVNPNNHLARDVGLDLTREGYVQVDEEGYTSIPGVFAAGDISSMHTHQVVSAVHEGAEAAQTANYYLYSDYQRN
jgi:thioredoxin reductase (NADPH)